MKKIFILYILCCFFIGANINYTQYVHAGGSIEKTQIKEAYILEQYIRQYIVRIQIVEKQFPSIDSQYIKNILQSIETILVKLDNIQKQNYNTLRNKEILDGTIQYMNQLNKDIVATINNIQRKEKQELQKKIQAYKRPIKRIYDINNKIINAYSTHYLHKKDITYHDRQNIKIIISLRDKNQKLIAYNQYTYKNHRELDAYIIPLIQSIRNDIMTLRNTRRR